MYIKNKSVNNITVKELVTKADLNRSTFYNYYSDIPDMLNKLEEELYKEFLKTIESHIEKCKKNNDISKMAHEFIEDMCNVVKDNYDFCQCIFSKNGDLNFLFELEEMVENHLREQFKENFDKKVKSLTYIYSFIKSGFIGVLKTWMKGGCKESSKEIADLIYNLINGVGNSLKI